MGSVFALRVGQKRFLPLLDLGRPAPSTRLFTTLADEQRKAIFSFYFREAGRREWRPVGRIEWEALPPARAGEPTLELRLIPGDAGSLLLRLRERASGAARTYRLRLPEVPREAPSETPRPARRSPEAPLAAPAPSEALRAVRRPKRPSPRRRRNALIVAAAATLCVAAVLVLMRFTPLLETLAAGGLAAGGAAAAEDGGTSTLPQEPAAAETAAMPSAAPEASTPEASAPDVEALETRAPEPEKPAFAAQAAPAGDPAGALSYRVQWGDTLWQITEQYYGNPYLYSILAGENAIVDPDLIIPGTELRLPSRIDERDRKQ